MTMLKKYFISFVLLVCISFVFIEHVCCFIHPVGEEEYKVLVSLASGTFKKATNERTNAEKAAVIKFWRAKGRFSLDENGKVLLFDSKRVSIKIAL